MSNPFNSQQTPEGESLRRESISIINDNHYFSLTLRDLTAIVFRQWRLLTLSFLIIFCFTLWWSGALTPNYKAEMRILVRHGRVDPVVTSQSDAPNQVMHEEISEAELNSEGELLKSQDILQQVVLTTGLRPKARWWQQVFGKASDKEKIARAVRTLGDQLEIEPLRMTNMISVTLVSSDPDRAAQELGLIGKLYVEKHLLMHRSSGEFTFFDQETERLRHDLDIAESRLTDFTRQHGVVSAQYERDLTLQRASEQEASLAQTQTAIAETGHRIEALAKQTASTPPRMITQSRTADNPQLLQQIKSTLLTLELKRSELLSKFAPTYPLVVEVEKQISETRAAIAGEQTAPVRDETTDQNPTYQWLKSELAKARTELSGLRAREATNRAVLAKYRDGATELQEGAIIQQDLLRTAKIDEERYMLYRRKKEEARINDALDRGGILNVAIAEPPTVPALPARSLGLCVVLAIFLASTGSVGLALASDFLDPSFRTPDEVSTFLELPVLASLPKAR